jgi:serine protease Do
VGDWVAAVGAPYGLGATVTAGIISATARPRAMSAVDDLLQTDAVTFPDSAGGPLLDARGRVVGITTILTGQDFGISFAMPANAARRVFAQLAREGRVARGTLDARVQRLTAGLVRAFSIPELSGVIVSEVSARGAAATAGLRAGDVLVALEGKPLDSPYAVERALRDSRPGQVASVTYWRKGQVQVSPVKLGRESDEAPAPPFSSPIAIRLQFEVRAITPELGVVVAHVRRSGAPAEARVRAGDVIRELNGQPVRTIADFDRLARAVKPGEWVGLLVQRGRVPVYVAVEARQD